MKIRLLVFVWAVIASLTLLNTPSVQAQPNTITTSATFGDMISTFPQAVLSTINSVVLQSTNATSAAPLLDSTARKDNLALQMGMWESGRVGAGAKYWLTELTALRVAVQANGSAGVDIAGEMATGNATFRVLSDTGTPPTAKANGTESRIIPSVNVNMSLFAAIEKHLFAKRNLSPFVGFGCGVSIVSRNYSVFTNGFGVGIDSGDVYYSGRYVGSLYIGTSGNAKRQGTENSQVVLTTTTVGLSAYIMAGVEYFILPSLSLTGDVILSGGVAGSMSIDGSFRQSQAQFDPNRAGSFYPSASNYKASYDSFKPGISVSANLGFSSAISLSLYFGRNVLGDIVNAFSSGTLFQW